MADQTETGPRTAIIVQGALLSVVRTLEDRDILEGHTYSTRYSLYSSKRKKEVRIHKINPLSGPEVSVGQANTEPSSGWRHTSE